MKTSIIVKEYESIIDVENKQEWMKYQSLPSNTFNDLKSFIEENNSRDSNIDSLELMKIGYKREYGYIITVKNYVGLIQMQDGTQIEVLPKLTFDDEGNILAKRVFLNMLMSLKEFSGKVFNTANLNTDRMNLYEIFISMYINGVRNLTKKGIKSFYERKEGNLKVYKGKLKVKEQLSININHKERFYVDYDEYTANRPENRLIKSTLLYLQKKSNHIKNITEIRNLLNGFELIDASSNYDNDFSQVVINRENQEYETLMTWSKVFLYNKSFTTFSGSTLAKALLFPMEKLFESYVASELKKATKNTDWTITTQDKGVYLFDNPQIFSLRPDIVIKKNNEELIILDTKWKMLNDNERKNYGISQTDMYQMYAYAKKYNASKVIVIYPLSAQIIKHVDKEMIFTSEDNVTIQLFLIDLVNMNTSVSELLNII